MRTIQPPTLKLGVVISYPKRFISNLSSSLVRGGVSLIAIGESHLEASALVLVDMAQQWHDEIGAALRRCDWFVLGLSPHAIESIWVKRELLFSLQQNRFENKMVPLLYQPCVYERLSWTLSLFQMTDFTQTFEQGCP